MSFTSHAISLLPTWIARLLCTRSPILLTSVFMAVVLGNFARGPALGCLLGSVNNNSLFEDIGHVHIAEKSKSDFSYSVLWYFLVLIAIMIKLVERTSRRVPIRPQRHRI